MEEKKPIERRKYVRFDVQAKVDFQIKAKEEGGACADTSALTKNVSAEGICFTSEKKLAPGSGIELNIFLPDEAKPIHLKGEVRWSQPARAQREGQPKFDTGVKLFTLDKSDETRFIKYACDKMTERLSRYLHL